MLLFYRYNLMAKTINLENVLRPWQKHYIQNKKRFNVLVVHRR